MASSLRRYLRSKRLVGAITIAMGALVAVLSGLASASGGVITITSLIAVVATWIVVDRWLGKPDDRRRTTVSQSVTGGRITGNTIHASDGATVSETVSDKGAIVRGRIEARGGAVRRVVKSRGVIKDSDIESDDSG